jgi:hypothetical protein
MSDVIPLDRLCCPHCQGLRLVTLEVATVECLVTVMSDADGHHELHYQPAPWTIVEGSAEHTSYYRCIDCNQELAGHELARTATITSAESAP